MLRVKHERLRRGWNQTALAFYAGISVADISRIETGRLRPYPAQMEKLARVLGLDSAALLQDVEVADRHVERLARERQARANGTREDLGATTVVHRR